MSELKETWHDWTYDGRGWYLVNDPEITFYSEEEATAYCDEHNRALGGQAAQAERAKIVEWLRERQAAMPCQSDSAVEQLGITADHIEAGEHLK